MRVATNVSARTIVVVTLLALGATAAHAVSVEGTVREAGTRRPVPAAVVVIEGPDGTSAIETTSDDQGAYVLALPDGATGSVIVQVETSGYAPLVQPVQLRRDRVTTSVDLYLVPTDEGGETRVRERRSRDNVARGVHRIEEREVNEMPGTYGDPAKAIENFPGMGRVLLSQGSLFVRGASPGESAVYVDDYEIPDLYHFTGSTSVINIPFVDSVELVPGVFSARYGRSTGGVVTLKTRKLPTDDVHGFAKADVIDAGAYVGVPIGPKIAFGASARRSYLDVLRGVQIATRGTGNDVVLVPTYWDYQLKLDWDTAPGHELVVFAFGSGDRELYTADGNGTLDRYERTNDSDFHRVSMRYSDVLGSGVTHVLTVVGGYERNNLLEQQGLRARARATYDMQLRDELTWRIGSTRVIGGIDGTLRRDALRYGGLLVGTGVHEIAPIELTGSVLGRASTRDSARLTGAGYLEATVEPLAGVVLVPGVRLESMMLDGPNDTPTPYVSFEPRFASTWQLGSGAWATMLRAGAGATSRPPDVEEVAAAAAAGLALPPQHAVQFQGGVEQGLGGDMSLSLTGFAIFRDNLTTRSIDFPVPLVAGSSPVVSGGSGRSIGAEMLWRLVQKKGLWAWMTYAIARHERIDGVDGKTVNALASDRIVLSPFDTTHLVSAVGQTELPWGFRVGARWRLASGMPADDRAAGSIFDADTGRFDRVPVPRSDERFPSFSALDLRVDWSTLLPWCALTAYADLVNAGTVVFGRTVEATLYNFDNTQSRDRLGLPLIPAVGAKATF